jgi:hypothetical protein
MKARFKVTPMLQGLFSNMPVESGMPDADIVTSVNPPVPHKSFARIRNDPPASVTSQQLLMITRFAEHETGIDSASVLQLFRQPEQERFHPLTPLLAARAFSRSTKESHEIAHMVQGFATESGRILLFDRGSSFGYLTPSEESTDEAPDAPPATDCASGAWSWAWQILRFDRHPRVLVALAKRSLALRQACFADNGIEHLIGTVESGESSLTVVNDQPELSHRVFRGVFAKAQAVAIFGRAAMLVLPQHGKSFRLFEVHRGDFHASYIRESIGLFHRMRKFRVHGPSVNSVVAMLRGYLSYRSPQW